MSDEILWYGEIMVRDKLFYKRVSNIQWIDSYEIKLILWGVVMWRN